jgi:hypothetical protein
MTIVTSLALFDRRSPLSACPVKKWGVLRRRPFCALSMGKAKLWSRYSFRGNWWYVNLVEPEGRESGGLNLSEVVYRVDELEGSSNEPSLRAR